MVHKGAPRGVWGNTISSWQFGIYREHPPNYPPRPRNKQSRRLRYCVVAAMATIAALLVSIMVYDVARSHGAPSRDKDVIQRLLLLQTATLSPALPTATVSPPTTTTGAAPEPEETTPLPETTTIPAAAEEDSPGNSTEEPRARSITFYDQNTEGASPEMLMALPYSRYHPGGRKKVRAEPPVPSPHQKPPARPHHHGKKANPQSSSADETQSYPKFWKPQEGSDRRVMTPSNPRPFHPGSPHHVRLLNQQGFISNPTGPSAKPYAQLTNYRYPSDAKNIQDIIKYLTDDSKKSQSQRNRQNLIFGASGHPRKAVKFSGVYINPQTGDGEASNEYRDSSEEKSTMGEMMVSNRHHNKYAKASASSLNGHAYIADPFHNYKPKDPSEVNLLASSDFRFAPSDMYVRFNDQKTDNRQSFNGNNKYFPRPPINFAKPKPTLPSITEENNQMNRYPGTYTSAIYRPFGQDQQSSKAGQGVAKRKPRPFSVMLDIYPMTDVEPSSPQGGRRPAKPASSTPLRQVWMRPRPLFGQSHGKGPGHEDQKEDASETRHQMIVHLNLYPRKKKAGKANSRSDSEIPEFHVSIESSNGALERMWGQHPIYDDENGSDGDSEEGTNKEGEDVQKQSESLNMAEGRSFPAGFRFGLTTPTSVTEGGFFNHRTHHGDFIVEPSSVYQFTANETVDGGLLGGQVRHGDVFLHGVPGGSSRDDLTSLGDSFVTGNGTAHGKEQEEEYLSHTSTADGFTTNGSGGWNNLSNGGTNTGAPSTDVFGANGSGEGAGVSGGEDSQTEFLINVQGTGASMLDNVTDTLQPTQTPQVFATTSL